MYLYLSSGGSKCDNKAGYAVAAKLIKEVDKL